MMDFFDHNHSNSQVFVSCYINNDPILFRYVFFNTLNILFRCNLYMLNMCDKAVTCYLGVVLTIPKQSVKDISFLGVVLIPPLQNCNVSHRKM